MIYVQIHFAKIIFMHNMQLSDFTNFHLGQRHSFYTENIMFLSHFKVVI